MTDAFPQRPDSSDSDGPPHPPTFVQIRPPAAPIRVWLKLGVLCVGLTLVMALGWVFHRVADKRDASVVTQAAPTMTGNAPTTQAVPVDLYAELERRTIDAAASAPVWARESLMDRVSPFDPSASDRMPSSTPPDTPPADTASVTPEGPREVSVRLAKGETIGSALQKLGLASDAIADVISALAAHVSLKRLPTGLGMTVQIRPAGEAGTKPILEMLTLHPEGRRAITLERDAKGNYAVEQRRRSSAR
jgi:hypothetical protein